MNFTTGRLINIVFGVAMTLFIFLGIFTILKFKNYSDYGNAVDHTQRVLNRISQVSALHDSMESNQRSFLLTAKPRYLTNFKQATDSLKNVVRDINSLISDNPRQVNNAIKLSKVTNLRISQMYLEMINDTTKSIYKFEQGKLLDDNFSTSLEFTNILKLMFNEESRLLKKRLTLKAYKAKLTPILLGITSLTAMILIIIAFLLSNNELKKRLKVQDLLEEKIEDLNLSNRQLEQFARISSHDLQEPMRKISIFSDQLMTRFHDEIPPQALTIVQRINSSAIRMIDLIKDILAFSNVATADIDIEKTDVDVQQVWNSVMNDYSEAISDKKAVVSSDSLPIIYAYNYQIYQLFQNLLSNSLKFSDPARSVEINLKHRIKQLDGDGQRYVHIFTFKDNGLGFDDTYKDKIFQIFGRLNKTTEGTGIGLAICRQVMQNHGGEIDVSSTIGVGTLFTLTFPGI